MNLWKIEIKNDCELQIIEKYSFNESKIHSFTVSQHVKKICEGAFANCMNLKIIEFDDNSEIDFIHGKAFKGSWQILVTCSPNLSDRIKSVLKLSSKIII